MATAEILDSSSLEIKVPAPAVGTLSSTADQAANTLSPVPTVADRVANVSSLVEQQMEVADITRKLRIRLVPIMPEFSFSTGISGEEAVGEFANMVNMLNTVRKSRASEVIH